MLGKTAPGHSAVILMIKMYEHLMKFHPQSDNIVLASIVILITSKLITCQMDLDPSLVQGTILSIVLYISFAFNGWPT